MKNVVMISDFTLEQIPFGGSEHVNDCICKSLNLDFINSKELKFLDKEIFYIISNISLMDSVLIDKLQHEDYNYIIIENDYKIVKSRWPWIYSDNIVPKHERTNYKLYKNAKAVFVQCIDHLNVYKANEVEGNFINLETSIWGNEDLNLLRSIIKKEKFNKAAIYATDNWIKNTNESILYCKNKGIEYELIPNLHNRKEFLEKLSFCSKLIFFPKARETFCRLLVEARCLNLKIITNKIQGAMCEEWFKKYHGEELIEHLRIKSKDNIEKIRSYIK
jgi:hypothetical protein